MRKTLNNFIKKYKYNLVTLLAHVQFIIFFAWWMIPAGIVFNNIVNYLYLHRVYTHKHYKFGERTDLVFQFLATMLNLSSPNIYAAVHMKHHANTDTENDPHSPIHMSLWKIYVSLWDKRFAPDRKFLKRYKCVFYKHHMKIALVTAIFLPWITVCAHWMSKVVIHPVHRNGKAVDLSWVWGLFMWGEEKHKTHHERNRHHGDLLDKIGAFIEYASSGREEKVS